MLARLLQLDLTRFDLTSLRYISSMGAALAPTPIRQIRERFPRVLLFSMYSQTEACNALGLDPAEIDRRPASVGKPLAGTQAWIVDETDRRLGPSEVGELVIAGGHVRSGYWNSPDASAQRFRPGKLPGEFLCYTGDMFKTDEDNYFYFVGHSDEVVKSGGRKVAPREIEDALYRLEGVIEAAVVGIDDPVQGQVLKAFVVVDGAAAVTETRVLRHCSRILERFMMPRSVELRPELPKTATGKINKAELVRQETGPSAGYPSEFPTL
jgi:acyl-coenzyme A synthetase/AMP-(fatty) acid ligase